MSKKKKKKQFLNLWDFILPLFLLLILTSGGVLIYKERNRQQEIADLQNRIQELQEQARKQYYLQNNLSTTYLVQSPEVQAFFSDLLTAYAEKFARSRNLLLSLPLEFGGFYLDKNIGNGYREMGRCTLENVVYPRHGKIASISLNHLYLMNKFGCEKYFTSNPEYGDYSYLEISFSKMLETCSHELAGSSYPIS